MPRGLSNKEKRLLEDWGFATTKIDRREKYKRNQNRKTKKGKKRYYNA